MSIYDISKVSRNNYIKDVITACEQEVNSAHADFLNIENSIMCLANSENIDLWEKWFELSPQPDWVISDRVDRLIYTFNSRGFFTPNFLKEQAKIFTNGEIDITELFSSYHFIIQFTSMIGTPPNIENFREMVDVNKPAHLTYEIKYRYRTWGELKPFKWETLKAYTWEEARSRAEIKEV